MWFRRSTLGCFCRSLRLQKMLRTYGGNRSSWTGGVARGHRWGPMGGVLGMDGRKAMDGDWSCTPSRSQGSNLSTFRKSSCNGMDPPCCTGDSQVVHRYYWRTRFGEHPERQDPEEFAVQPPIQRGWTQWLPGPTVRGRGMEQPFYCWRAQQLNENLIAFRNLFLAKTHQ